MEFFVDSVLIGAGATAVMDAWTSLRRRLFGVAPADYGLVGRWIAGMARGRFHHERIGATPPVRGERLIGWTAHYLIGITFAGVLLAIWGPEWARGPRPWPAMIVGAVSVLAPFLLMQPGMGLGIAASRTARPAISRLNSVVTHTVFGAGLYFAGLFLGIVKTT
jgi:hypothetical protein